MSSDFGLAAVSAGRQACRPYESGRHTCQPDGMCLQRWLRSSVDLRPQRTRALYIPRAPRGGKPASVASSSLPACEQWIGADHEAAYPQFGQVCKDCIEVMLSADIQDMEFQPEGLGLPTTIFIHLGLDNGGIVRVDEQAYDFRRWKQLVQKFQSLRHHFHVCVGSRR